MNANVQLLMEKSMAFNAGDVGALKELWAEDAVWHAAGNNAMSGDARGRDAIGRWFAECDELLGGDTTVEIQDVLFDDDYVVFFNHMTCHREGARLEQVHMNAWRFEDGLAIEGWWLPDDVAAFDAFVGPRRAAASPARRASRPRSAG